MRENTRTPNLIRTRHRLEWLMWSSPVWATVLPVGVHVAVLLRDRGVISPGSLGWCTFGLTMLAFLLVSGVGITAHEKLVRVSRELTPQARKPAA